MSNKSKIFIRSTVLPGTANALAHAVGRHVYAMPEFLTARCAHDDMSKLPIIVGGTHSPNEIEKLFPGKKIINVTNNEAELTKYAHNCFLAAKVNFFNFIYELAQRTNISYDNVISAVQITDFIKPTHTNVPGPDGKFGFGGECFPKDLYALNRYLESMGITSEMLLGVECDNYRNRLKWEWK
jgi:UDPglucose 6-dehydrogenase